MPEPDTKPTLLTAAQLAEIDEEMTAYHCDRYCDHVRLLRDHIRAQHERIAAARHLVEGVGIDLAVLQSRVIEGNATVWRVEQALKVVDEVLALLDVEGGDDA